MRKPTGFVCALAFVVTWVGERTDAANRAAEVDVRADSIAARPLVDCARVSITVSDPKGDVASQQFERGAAPVLELGQGGDGVYTYEVRLVPSDGSEPGVESGYFRLQDGAVAGQEDARAALDSQQGPAVSRGPQADDIPINDDLIVKGRMCAGTECVLNESFDFEALRLKQPAPGISFIDTHGGLGAHTWQILPNSLYGDVAAFAIGDMTAGTIPFTLRGNAPMNSLYVNAFGNVGVGTSTPFGSLQVTRTQTPSLLLDQTGGTGYAPQAWRMNVAGDGTFVFVDFTHSTTPVLIAPGSPGASLLLTAKGRVGMGASTPESTLHVRRSNGTSKLLVEETSSTVMGRNLFELKNTGPVNVRLNNTSAGNYWGLGHNGLSNFYVANQLTPGLFALLLEPDGDLTIQGTLTQSSDRDTKDALASVHPDNLLDRVAGLAIGKWHRKTDEPGVRHLGPMAQDFAAAFGLGDDERRISPLDVGGVALVAVQALDARIEALELENADLVRQLDELEATGGDR